MSEPLPVPEAWRADAEEVRAHLCALRGRGPFLSPADALQLVRWFEDGVAVVAILQALERAAASRRQNGSKVPLALVHARRHLGRATRGVFHREAPAPDPTRPLAPVVRALSTAPRSPALEALSASLLAVPDRGPDQVVRDALGHVRAFFDARWLELGPPDREVLVARAEASLGDLIGLVDERTRTELVAEATRDLLRSGYPALTAASLHEAVAPRGSHGP